MKSLFKSSVIVVIVLLSAVEGIAQEKAEQPKKNIFGIVAGVNVSSVTNYDGKTLVGFTGGLYWDCKFSDRFFLSSNFVFSQRGENENGDVESLKLGYLYAPIMLKYMVNDKLGIASGVFWDNLLTVSENTIHTRETLKASDFGIPIALSHNISKNLELGVSYNIGLLNKSVIPGTTLRNNWGTATIAYVFR